MCTCKVGGCRVATGDGVLSRGRRRAGRVTKCVFGLPDIEQQLELTPNDIIISHKRAGVAQRSQTQVEWSTCYSRPSKIQISATAAHATAPYVARDAFIVVIPLYLSLIAALGGSVLCSASEILCFCSSVLPRAAWMPTSLHHKGFSIPHTIPCTLSPHHAPCCPRLTGCCCSNRSTGRMRRQVSIAPEAPEYQVCLFNSPQSCLTPAPAALLQPTPPPLSNAPNAPHTLSLCCLQLKQQSSSMLLEEGQSCVTCLPQHLLASCCCSNNSTRETAPAHRRFERASATRGHTHRNMLRGTRSSSVWPSTNCSKHLRHHPTASSSSSQRMLRLFRVTLCVQSQ